MMYHIRYRTASGEISGVFPEGTWESHLPEGHEVMEVALGQEVAQALMQETGRYAVRDVGGGPELYEVSDGS